MTTLDITATRQPLVNEPANNTFVVWYDSFDEPYTVRFRSDANAWDDGKRWFNADQAGSDLDGPSTWSDMCEELGADDGPHLLVPGARVDDLTDELDRVREQAHTHALARYTEIERLERRIAGLEKQCNEQMHQLAAADRDRDKAAQDEYCEYGYPLGGGSKVPARIDWCGLKRGHSGLHYGGDRQEVGFTDASTVRRGAEAATQRAQAFTELTGRTLASTEAVAR